MVEDQQIIEDMKVKVRKVMDMYQELKEENELLKKQNGVLEKNTGDREQELEFLKNKYKKLKLTKGIVASSDDKHEAKLQINRIVREIDKCIALLNR